MDKKTLQALTISFIILAAWAIIYPRLFPPPPPPVTTPADHSPANSVGTGGSVPAPADGTGEPARTADAAEAVESDTNASSTPAPKQEAPEGTPQEVVETQFARITIDSVGGTVRSWTLAQYRDDKGQPYDLVSPGSRTSGIYPLQISSGIGNEFEATTVEEAILLASQKLGRPPASLQTEILDPGKGRFLVFGGRPAVIRVLNAQDPLAGLNRARFVIERGQGAKPDRSEMVRLVYSDGEGLEAIKTLEFSKDSYFVRVSADVKRHGKPVPAKIIWGPGLGTPHRDDSHRYEAVVASGDHGVVTRVPGYSIHGPAPVEGSWSWGGAEEQYFAAVFLPVTGTATLDVLPVFPPPPPPDKPQEPKPTGTAPATPEEKLAPPKHLVVMIPTGQSYDLYVGPKDYQLLTGLGRNLPGLVDFSPGAPIIGPLIGVLAKFLYAALRWLYGIVPNYGVGIVILTAAVKVLFYPITQRTMVKMRQVQQQMAKLKPKVDSIKNKYKKVKDIAGRNKMNEEVMELYRREGVNPMASLGGCLPLLIQLPILYGFYRVLNASIELRQAPFFGWIRDLSRSDPYYVTPFVMGASMFLQQRLAMTNATDPQAQMQQRMMLLMPIIFTYTFLNLPSGLVLYWFVNNVLGIAQQMLINRQAKALDAQAAAQATGKA